jgi:hypothetical protein
MFVGIIKFVCSNVELVHKLRKLLTTSVYLDHIHGVTERQYSMYKNIDPRT